MGISKSGLDSFLKGCDPYTRTGTKLMTWYARERHTAANAIGRDDVDAAIAVLALYISGVGGTSAREGRIREIAAQLPQVDEPTPKNRGARDFP